MVWRRFGGRRRAVSRFAGILTCRRTLNRVALSSLGCVDQRGVALSSVELNEQRRVELNSVELRLSWSMQLVVVDAP